MATDNEFRSQSQMGGRVDYPVAGKPTFDLAKEARGQRAKMGGSQPGVQPPPTNKVPPKQAPAAPAPEAAPAPDMGKMGVAPHGKKIKDAIDTLEKY